MDHQHPGSGPDGGSGDLIVGNLKAQDVPQRRLSHLQNPWHMSRCEVPWDAGESADEPGQLRSKWNVLSEGHQMLFCVLSDGATLRVPNDSDVEQVLGITRCLHYGADQDRLAQGPGGRSD